MINVKGFMLEEYEKGNVLHFDSMEEVIEYLQFKFRKNNNPKEYINRVLKNEHKFLGFQVDWNIIE